MKTSVPVFIAILTLALLVNLSCTKSSNDNAVITGFDLTKCNCCWGLMINFDGNTLPYSGKYYLIKNNPDSLGITLDSDFPIYAEVTWKVEPECGGNKFITLTSFRRR